MPNFRSIPPDLLSEKPLEPLKPSDSNDWDFMPRTLLEKIHNVTQQGSHKVSWGFTIIRTTYCPDSSDAAFIEAVERIDSYIKSSVESLVDYWLPNPAPNFQKRALRDLLSRYSNDIIQDRETLSNVNTEQVYHYFKNWVQDHGGMETENPRYQNCLMLDSQSIEDILSVPRVETEGFANLKDLPCCKLVPLFEFSEEPHGWFHCSLTVLMNHWFFMNESELLEEWLLPPDDESPNWEVISVRNMPALDGRPRLTGLD